MGARAINGWTAVKVFSATKAKDREQLGETITAWLAAHASLEVVDTEVVQSSDEAYHCTTIVTFLRPRLGV